MSRRLWDYCTVCDEDTRSVCKDCKATYYCSKACSLQDWETHRLLCESFARFNDTTRPSDKHFLGLMFPDNGEKKPRLVWMLYTEDSCGIQKPNFEPIIGCDSPLNDEIIYRTPDERRHRPITIRLCYRASLPFEGSTINPSVESITSTRSGEPHDWRGLMFAYVEVGYQGGPRECQDISMYDFRRIVDYLCSFNTPIPSYDTDRAETYIQGVRINCFGDQKVFGRPVYEAVEIPSTDTLCFDHEKSEIAERIGLPIFSRRFITTPTLANGHSLGLDMVGRAMVNSDSIYLHLGCDPVVVDPNMDIPSWGRAPMHWYNRGGSIHVFRQDLKPLSPLHLEALCKYCKDYVYPLLVQTKDQHDFEKYNSEKHPNKKQADEISLIDKTTVVTKICRDTFLTYWDKFIEEKLEQGCCESRTSPYDVE